MTYENVPHHVVFTLFTADHFLYPSRKKIKSRCKSRRSEFFTFNNLRLPYTCRFFVVELQIISPGSNRVNICRAISLPHTSRFFVATNRVEAWSRAPILSQTCLNSSHTSRQVKIFLSADKTSACVRRH